MNVDYRNSKITDPSKYFAYTSPDTYPATIQYVLLSTLEAIKESNIPQKNDFSTFGGSYFRNTNGEYGGCGCGAYFLSAKEIQEYMMKDINFVNRAIKTNVIWFLPKEVADIFVF